MIIQAGIGIRKFFNINGRRIRILTFVQSFAPQFARTNQIIFNDNLTFVSYKCALLPDTNVTRVKWSQSTCITTIIRQDIWLKKKSDFTLCLKYCRIVHLPLGGGI